MPSYSRKAVLKAISLIQAGCNQRIQNYDDLVEIWHIALEEFSDMEIGEGIRKISRMNFEFMPSPGKFIEIILSDDQGNLETKALVAWGEVLKTLNPYVDNVWSDTAIAETIRRIGNNRLCAMTEHEAAFIKNDFVKIYSETKRRNQEYFPLVSGIHENCAKVLIGFENKTQIGHAMQMIEEQDKGDKQMKKYWNIKQLAGEK